jgi:hypothetical protein
MMMRLRGATRDNFARHSPEFKKSAPDIQNAVWHFTLRDDAERPRCARGEMKILGFERF